MDGVGTPNLIVQSSGSEHIYSLRPSDASALQGADVVFWVGHGMETFLAKPIGSLSASATVVELSETPGLTLYDYREGGPFEKHDHAHEGAADDDHDHAAKDGHAHDDGVEAGHDDHEKPEQMAQHEHGAHDMHVWLDPKNAAVMVEAIAATLSEKDPDNAARYAANAQRYVARLEALTTEIAAELAPVRDKPVIVFHDAYQYFEKRFGVNTVGSITVSPETTPGAQRVSEIKARLASTGAVCVFCRTPIRAAPRRGRHRGYRGPVRRPRSARLVPGRRTGSLSRTHPRPRDITEDLRAGIELTSCSNFRLHIGLERS